jgi:hypothetical protein
MATWTPTYVNQLIVGWSLCCSAWLMPGSSSLTPTGIPQARFGQGRRGLHNWRWPRHLPADPRAYAQARSLLHAHPFSLLRSIAHDFGWCTPCAEVVTTSRSIPPSFACTVRPTTTRSCTVPSRTSSSCQNPTTVTCASWYGTFRSPTRDRFRCSLEIFDLLIHTHTHTHRSAWTRRSGREARDTRTSYCSSIRPRRSISRWPSRKWRASCPRRAGSRRRCRARSTRYSAGWSASSPRRRSPCLARTSGI